MPSINAVIVDPISMRKISESYSFAFEFYKDSYAPIIYLLLFCGPSNIPGLVIPIVIWVTIQCCIWWPWSDMRIKRCKIICPRLMHFYPSATVIIKALVLAICAPIFRRCPTHISGGTFPSLGLPGAMPMSQTNGFQYASKQATATSSMARSKFLSLNNHAVAAVAFAVPTAMRNCAKPLGGSWRNRYQSSKSLLIQNNPLHGCILA